MSQGSHYADAVSDIVLREAESQGNTLRQLAQIRANQVQQSGANWGTTLQSLGQIPQQFEQQQHARQVEDQQGQIRQQQLEGGALELADKKRSAAAEQALSSAMSNALAPDGTIDYQKLSQGLAGTPAAAKWPAIQQQLQAARESSLKIGKLQGEVNAAERDHVSALANAADTAGSPEEKAAVLLTGLASGVKDGTIQADHAHALIGQFLDDNGQPDPAKVTDTLARMKQLSAADVEKRAQAGSAAAETANRAAQLPGIAADAAVRQQVAAGMVDGLTPEQQSQRVTQQTNAERQAAAQAETARHNVVSEATAEKRAAQAGAAGSTGTDPKDIADAIIRGDQPPTLTGLYRNAGPVRAELARKGYNLTQATQDWTATQKHLATLNGAQQTRLNQSINALPDLLDTVDALASQWKGGRFPILNKANLVLAKNGAYGEDVASVARQLDTQIADVTSDLGNVYMGGNSPTDHALGLAAKSLSSDWSEKVLKDMVRLAKQNVIIRRNSIVNTGVQGASPTNPYAPTPEAPTVKPTGRFNPATGKVEALP